MFEKKTLLHSIERGGLVFLAFTITTLMASNPEWGTVTLGSIAYAILHWVTSNLEK